MSNFDSTALTGNRPAKEEDNWLLRSKNLQLGAISLLNPGTYCVPILSSGTQRMSSLGFPTAFMCLLHADCKSTFGSCCLVEHSLVISVPKVRQTVAFVTRVPKFDSFDQCP